jgi:hypothetical protein
VQVNDFNVIADRELHVAMGDLVEIFEIWQGDFAQRDHSFAGSHPPLEHPDPEPHSSRVRLQQTRCDELRHNAICRRFRKSCAPRNVAARDYVRPSSDRVKNSDNAAKGGVRRVLAH